MSEQTALEILKVVAMLCQSHIADWRGLAEQRACQRELLTCAANVKEASGIPFEFFNCVKKK